MFTAIHNLKLLERILMNTIENHVTIKTLVAMENKTNCHTFFPSKSSHENSPFPHYIVSIN